MYAAALSAIGLGVYEVSVFTVGPSTALAQAGSVLVILGLCALPVSAAVAVFKYLLYDIDVVINRTLAYGSLAALITGVYVAIEVLSRFSGQGSSVGAPHSGVRRLRNGARPRGHLSHDHSARRDCGQVRKG